MKTTIILIRHAECQGNIENKLSGITDYELTAKGKEQAKLLAKHLKKVDISAIYTSPLIRAKDTAKIIMEDSKIHLINIVNDLKEIDYGVCDGMDWENIEKKYPNLKKDWKEIHHYPIGIPRQEEFTQLQKRISNCILKITNDNLGKKIVIVSHGIAISSFLCLVKKISNENCNKLKTQENTSYNIIEYENEEFKLIAEAISKHLKG